METTDVRDVWALQVAAEIANEPQWVVWMDAAGESEWADAELASYQGPIARLTDPPAG